MKLMRELAALSAVSLALTEVKHWEHKPSRLPKYRVHLVQS
jgi:hypothetical protein